MFYLVRLWQRLWESLSWPPEDAYRQVRGTQTALAGMEGPQARLESSVVTTLEPASTAREGAASSPGTHFGPAGNHGVRRGPREPSLRDLEAEFEVQLRTLRIELEQARADADAARQERDGVGAALLKLREAAQADRKNFGDRISGLIRTATDSEHLLAALGRERDSLHTELQTVSKRYEKTEADRRELADRVALLTQAQDADRRSRAEIEATLAGLRIELEQARVDADATRQERDGVSAVLRTLG